MNALHNVTDYVARMLRDPVDGSPSTVRHLAVALIGAAILVAVISAFLKYDASATVGVLAGGGGLQAFARNKATPAGEP